MTDLEEDIDIDSVLIPRIFARCGLDIQMRMRCTFAAFILLLLVGTAAAHSCPPMTDDGKPVVLERHHERLHPNGGKANLTAHMGSSFGMITGGTSAKAHLTMPFDRYNSLSLMHGLP